MSETDKNLTEGGAKDRNANGIATDHDPALQKASRQAVKNQSSVKPDQYPHRDKNPS